MTQEEFRKIRADVNATFWARYMSEVRGLFTISDAFYAASEEIQPKIYDWFYFGYDATPYNTDFYHYGLISYDPDRSFVDEDEEDPEWFTPHPGKRIYRNG